MKHLFIINPVAGKTVSLEHLEKQIKDAARKEHLDYEIVFTEYPGHATELARGACATGEDLRIYACGGDGTLNEVVNGAVGFENAAVTMVPTGTGNDFVKIFGADRDKFRDPANFADSEVRALDVVKCCGRYSINVCSVGFDARIGTEVHKYTRIPLVGGKLAYNISVVVNIIKGIHQPMRITVDGERVFQGRHSLVCVCNGRYYGGGYMPVPEAEPDDGYIDCLIVKKVSRLKLAQLIGKYAKGLYSDMPDVITKVTAKRIEIELDREDSVNLDGELIKAKNIVFEVPEEKLNFFFPKGTSYVHKSRQQDEAMA